MAGPKNLASIQFLRFVAATLVVFDHSIAVAFPDKPLMQHLAPGFGASGVHIFFVISGFIMLYTSFNGPKRRISVRQFLLRRFVRIFPIYWLYAALYLFCGAADPSFVLSIPNLAASAMLLPGYSSLIIGPGWTLAYEIYFYLCFAVFMTLPMPRGLFLMATFFAASILLRWSLGLSGAAFDVAGGSIIFDFVIGASIGWLVTNGIQPKDCRIALIMILLSITWLTVAYLSAPSKPVSVFIWGAPSGLLIAGVAFLEMADQLPRSVQRLSFLGDNSYTLYLLHILLLGLALRILAPLALPALIVSFAAYAICVAISVAAYRFLERPLVNFLHTAVKRPGSIIAAS